MRIFGIGNRATVLGKIPTGTQICFMLSDDGFPGIGTH